jgi:Domain of unknown function (DUF1848)
MQKIISASRRTDIPAFYLDWFISRLKAGRFRLVNPFNRKVRVVPVSRDTVHSIVFWSKNYGILLDRLSELHRWRLFFQFTVNSESSLLEPGVLSLGERKKQLRLLTEIFGPRAVRWRFDPVCCYELHGERRNNLEGFEDLLDFAAGLGLDACTVSFMDPYRKIDRREKLIPGFRFIYPEMGRLLETASWMAAQAASRGIRLFTCCEKELVQAGIANLEAGGCIDHFLLKDIYGGSLSAAADRGQRRLSGCLCHKSIDVGSYSGQPCRCGCLYCYANPLFDGGVKCKNGSI